MVAGKSFFFSKIGVQSCVRFRCTLLHSYFALHTRLIIPRTSPVNTTRTLSRYMPALIRKETLFPPFQSLFHRCLTSLSPYTLCYRRYPRAYV